MDSPTAVKTGARAGRAQRRQVLVTASCLVLVAGLATAAVGQGAFFAAVQWRAAIVVLAAVVLALAAYPFRRADLRWGFILAGLSLAMWALVRAAAVGTLAGGFTWALFGAGAAAVFIVCRRLDASSREMLLNGLFAVAILVAATGWLGVAFHHRSWALPSAGLWRAASTLTYANATAAFLVPLTLVVLSRLTASPGSMRLSLTATGLLCGAGATLSRAGAIAFAVGFVVICALQGTRNVVRVAAGPVVGAAVALLGLIPSVPVTARPEPAVALAALGTGLGIAALTRRFPRGAVAIPVAILAAGGALAVAVIVINGAPSGSGAIRSLATSRLSLASPSRSGETAAAIRVIEQHPLAGVGPGRATLRWTGADGGLRVDRYDHDEYLQVLTDLGVIGAALLAVLLAAAIRGLWQGRLNLPGRATWAGVVAATAALAVHSAFDFIWHIPAIPLTAAALVGCAVPSITRPGELQPSAIERKEEL